MAHGPRASPLMNRAYYVFFRVPCFGPSLIVPCFKARVPKILGPARPTCVPCRASCLTKTCSCRAVPYGHVPCPCRATCRPAHWPPLGGAFSSYRSCHIGHNQTSNCFDYQLRYMPPKPSGACMKEFEVSSISFFPFPWCNWPSWI